MTTKPFVICIDGIIGVGKSTLIENLSSIYKTFSEPLEEWTLLEDFYKNPKKFGAAFQLQVLFSQFNQSKLYKNFDVVIIERCSYTSKHVFSKMLIEDGIIDSVEWSIVYDGFFKDLAFSPDVYIYLEISPEIALERIKMRSRNCETTITLKYLKSLEKSYKSFINTLDKVFIIDAFQSKEEIFKQAVEIIKQIV